MHVALGRRQEFACLLSACIDWIENVILGYFVNDVIDRVIDISLISQNFHLLGCSLWFFFLDKLKN